MAYFYNTEMTYTGGFKSASIGSTYYSGLKQYMIYFYFSKYPVMAFLKVLI